MEATFSKNRWWSAQIIVLGLVIGVAIMFLAAGSPIVSADAGGVLHIDAGSNQIHLNTNAIVDVTKVSHSAANQNTLDLTLPNNQFIFNCTSVANGTTVNLGQLGPGELRFQLAGQFNTGLASDNPDTFQHVNLAVQTATTVRMFWEDLFGGGDQDFNDCIVDVTITVVSIGGSTSFLTGDSGSTAGAIVGWSAAAAAVVALIASGTWFTRRRRQGKGM